MSAHLCPTCQYPCDCGSEESCESCGDCWLKKFDSPDDWGDGFWDDELNSETHDPFDDDLYYRDWDDHDLEDE